jgi:hypothetical protein
MPSWPLFLSDSNALDGSLWPYITQTASSSSGVSAAEAGRRGGGEGGGTAVANAMTTTTTTFDHVSKGDANHSHPATATAAPPSSSSSSSSSLSKVRFVSVALPAFQSQVYRSLLHRITYSAPHPSPSWSLRPAKSATRAPDTAEARTEELMNVGKAQYLRCNDSHVRAAAGAAIASIVRDFSLRKWFVVGSNTSSNSSSSGDGPASKTSGSRLLGPKAAAKSQNQKVKVLFMCRETHGITG